MIKWTSWNHVPGRVADSGHRLNHADMTKPPRIWLKSTSQLKNRGFYLASHSDYSLDFCWIFHFSASGLLFANWIQDAEVCYNCGTKTDYSQRIPFKQWNISMKDLVIQNESQDICFYFWIQWQMIETAFKCMDVGLFCSNRKTTMQTQCIIQ